MRNLADYTYFNKNGNTNSPFGNDYERDIIDGRITTEISKDVVGKTDPLTGLPAHGFLDPLKGWGGFGFYFLGSRATAYAKHPNDPAFLFDPDTMKPRVNNPAWVRAIQDVLDIMDNGIADNTELFVVPENYFFVMGEEQKE